MTTRIVPDDAAGRAAAVEALRSGGIVALPTDTVYGIGVALDSPGGITRLFAAKRRPPEKAVMLLLDDAAQAGPIGRMTPAAIALAEACWPGGLTVIVPQRSGIQFGDLPNRGREGRIAGDLRGEPPLMPPRLEAVMEQHLPHRLDRDVEVGRYLGDRQITTAGDRDDITLELRRELLGHRNILPARHRRT